jgi:hypothetical protein
MRTRPSNNTQSIYLACADQVLCAHVSELIGDTGESRAEAGRAHLSEQDRDDAPFAPQPELQPERACRKATALKVFGKIQIGMKPGTIGTKMMMVRRRPTRMNCDSTMPARVPPILSREQHSYYTEGRVISMRAQETRIDIRDCTIVTNNGRYSARRRNYHTL